jgi:hypothetical protein
MRINDHYQNQKINSINSNSKGATFNWGAILGYTAATGQFVPEICIPLYAACICWTMIYDTIYAYQDKEDDLTIGVKSTALRFGDKTSKWLCAFSTAMITNLAFVGVVTEQNWPFYASLIGFVFRIIFTANCHSFISSIHCSHLWPFGLANWHFEDKFLGGLLEEVSLKPMDRCCNFLRNRIQHYFG